MKVITTRILFFFNLLGLLSLIYLFLNSLNKAIVYEDSFILLRSPEKNIFHWFFIPHNGHIMAVSKILSTILVNLNFRPTTFFIPLGILIIFIGIYFLWQLIKVNLLSHKNNIIIFLFCSYFWISPWHWENLIWEFQFPWFIISTLVIISTYIFLKNKKVNEFNIYEKTYLFLSPLIAVLSTGAGICYVNCLSINYLARRKKNTYNFLGIFLAYFLFIAVKILNTDNNDYSYDFLTNLKYILVMLLTIFKAPISSNNNSSYLNWIIPILSSLLIQSFLIISINWRKFISDFSLDKKIALLTPIFFGVQFIMLLSLTRSNYGIHQGAVSRYLTCLVLIPIGLLIIFQKTNNEKVFINTNKSTNETILNSSKSNFLNLIIIICLILNTNSFLTTIYESHLSYNIRHKNFKIFQEACLTKLEPNKKFILEENFARLRKYYTTNIPPLPNTDNIEIYKQYINSEFCDKTNIYFN